MLWIVKLCLKVAVLEQGCKEKVNQSPCMTVTYSSTPRLLDERLKPAKWTSCKFHVFFKWYKLIFHPPKWCFESLLPPLLVHHALNRMYFKEKNEEPFTFEMSLRHSLFQNALKWSMSLHFASNTLCAFTIESILADILFLILMKLSSLSCCERSLEAYVKIKAKRYHR